MTLKDLKIVERDRGVFIIVVRDNIVSLVQTFGFYTLVITNLKINYCEKLMLPNIQLYERTHYFYIFRLPRH